ncbi:MAG: tRNA dihydrouridine(20/20a) synthase DusA [Pseudomonadota bacterium]
MTDPADISAAISEGRRLSVAPMMDWTDRHCRFLHRQLSRHALLYTEMVTAAAVVHGDRDRLLGFSPAEKPVALQLGGSEPALLAEAVRAALDYGYGEINLNVGCPSDRVQSGAFGACLMREPDLVARCCAAMIDAAEGRAEITVKSRIGVDEQDPERVLPDFIDRVAAVGVRHFAVHARKAWLDGLSPKENRDIPPLDYPLAIAMKRRRPDLNISINGGIASLEAAEALLGEGMDGAMIGRAAYHDPTSILAAADRRIFGADEPEATPEGAVEAMLPYIEARLTEGTRLNQITRHMLTLFQGRPGARRWRRTLSEGAHLPGAGPELVAKALGELAPASEAA